MTLAESKNITEDKGMVDNHDVFFFSFLWQTQDWKGKTAGRNTAWLMMIPPTGEWCKAGPREVLRISLL